MSSTQLSVIVRSVIKSESRELFIQTVENSIPRIRQLEGCIQLFMYEDMEHPNKFIILGTWASEELWRQHLRSDVARQLVMLGDSITTEFSIQKLHLVDM